MILRRLFGTALIAGAVAGTFSALSQLWLLQPLLAAAELVEVGDHTHANAGHLARHALTFAANIISFCGFALVMVALMEWFQPRPKFSPLMTGALWGGLGYIAIILAPTLGLPPNLPGVPVADIALRQTWWLIAVLSASASLWIALLSPLPVWKYVLAVLVFAAPHIYGAPTTDEVSNLPAAWAALFAVRSVGISFIAWMILGMLSAKILYKGY